MSPLPDTSYLYARADQISRHAETLRSRAADLVAAAGQTRWHSTAAAKCRAEIDGIARRMRHLADRIDDAADHLRRHARTIDHEIALLLAPVRAVQHVAAGAVHEVEHAAEAAAHGAARVTHGALRVIGLG